jgi:hypothetical protein
MAAPGRAAGRDDRAEISNPAPAAPQAEPSPPDSDQALEQLRASHAYNVALALAAGGWLGAVLAYAVSLWACRP